MWLSGRGRGGLEHPAAAPGMGGEQAQHGVPQGVQQGGEGFPPPEAVRLEEQVVERFLRFPSRFTGLGIPVLGSRYFVSFVLFS